jgi:HAE1 family hydrophobic/amphiphilic exporter-1
MQGIIGRFFFQFGMTVAFSVSVSLFVAFTLTPMLSARMLEESHGETRIGQAIESALGKLDAAYRWLIERALRHQVIVIVVAIASFVGALGLFKVIPAEFIPAEDRGEFRVYVDMPTGTRLEETMEVVDAVSTDLREVPGVEMTFATIGGGTQGEVNLGTIHVEMVSSDDRSFSQDDAMQYVRTVLADYREADIAVEPVGNVGGGGAQRQAEVQYLLLGEDFETLDRTADEILAELEQLPGFVDIDKSSSAGKPEVRVSVNRERASDLGVPIASVGAAIRTLYAGEKVSEVATDGERFDARVRMLENFRDDPNKILDLSVRSTRGQLVPLSNIVTVDTGTGPSKIERYNRQRQVTVMANLEDKALGPATQEVARISERVAPTGVEPLAAGRAGDLQETIGYMIEALLLAVILIYLILAAQFESFLHPLTIMLSLPLSLIGALGALALSGMTLNIFTMIGFIMLMGLVTKNAVLLVDYTNVLREEHGMDRYEALVEAGTVRLRPILMTTAAMIGGMMPVALALSAGGEQRAPMAVAVIGGLITSTLLTLVVVPVAYQLLDKLVERFGSDDEQIAAG